MIQLNKTTLQQWPEGEPEVMREMRVDQAAFNEPVIHVAKNVGDTSAARASSSSSSPTR